MLDLELFIFQIEEFGLFLTHHRLEVTLFDMQVLNLEIAFMVIRSPRLKCGLFVFSILFH
jgi:hypothetical protein